MINSYMFGTHKWQFCQSPELIENYKEAIEDEEMWDCHHRRETHNLETGEKLESFFSAKSLIQQGLYYQVPPEELIFLKHREHSSLHKKGFHPTEETRRKLSESLKGKPGHESFWKTHPIREETKRKISNTLKGHKMSESSRKKSSESHKGLPGNNNKRVICIDTLEVFDSCRAAACKYNVSQSCIVAAARGSQKTAAKLRWKYADQEILKEIGLPEDFFEKEEC